MPNLLQRLLGGVKTTQTSTTRSTSFDDQSIANSSLFNQLNFSGTTPSLTTKSCWNTSEKEVCKYANNNIIQANYTQILEKLKGKSKFIRSDYPRTAKKIEQNLKDVGFDNEFIDLAFYELYLGSGEIYLYLQLINEEVKLVAQPRFVGNLEVVTRIYENNRLKAIKINNELTVDAKDLYVLHNTKVGMAYYSNLKLAIPFIKLKNQLLDHNLDNATSGMAFKTLFSFDPKQLEGIDSETKALMNKNLENVKKQLKSLLESNDKSLYLPFQVQSQALQSNNAQNQTNFLLNYCDEQIQICSYSNGSMTGRDRTANRAVAEQDRDNFDQTTVKYFVQKIKDVANEWLIPKLVSDPENFVYDFYSEDTDETLKKRDQSLAILELITNAQFTTYLQSQNLKISKENIQEVLANSHGIELIDIDQIEKTKDLETEQSNEGFISRAIRANETKLNFTTLEFDTFYNSTEVKSLIDEYQQILTQIYSDVVKELTTRAKSDILFSQYMSEQDFEKYLSKLSMVVVNDSNDLFDTKYEDLPEEAKKFIQDTTKLHFEGGTLTDPVTKETNVYLGFDNTIQNIISQAEILDETFVKNSVATNLQSFKNNIGISLFNETFQGSAIRSGARWIGTLGKLDKNIRDHHRNNSGYAWEIGKNPPDKTNKNFYLERSCRCSRVYGTKEQLEESGFLIYQQQ
jgi:hypothetical protein